MNIIGKIGIENVVMRNERPLIGGRSGAEERVGDTHSDIKVGRLCLTDRRTKHFAIRERRGEGSGCERDGLAEKGLKIIRTFRYIVHSSVENTSVKFENRKALENTQNNAA